MKSNVQCLVSLDPIWWKDPPVVSVNLDDHELYRGEVTSSFNVEFHRELEIGTHRIAIQLLNKTDCDTNVESGQDKAIVVKSIEFFGIQSPRFVWQGLYEPMYPAHLKDQPSVLRYNNYLGWNGIWYLDFDAPVFTWIHRIESLGWIYD